MNDTAQHIIVGLIVLSAIVWTIKKIFFSRNEKNRCEGCEKITGKPLSGCQGCPLSDKCDKK